MSIILSTYTLQSAAAHFFVSTRTISRLFSDKMDVSFYRYVTQRRLIAAKSLILSGEPLESIGVQVGFADYSTFYRAFKQAFSISPRSLRNCRPDALAETGRHSPDHL